MPRPARSQSPQALVVSGLAELAAGALSGWVYTAVRAGAGRGKVKAARIRQWHLDLAMLGTATVAAGLAVPDPPKVVAAALGVGAWTNAMAFLPLAFDEELAEHPAFKAAAVASFVATSVGFTGMALTAARRRG